MLLVETSKPLVQQYSLLSSLNHSATPPGHDKKLNCDDMKEDLFSETFESKKISSARQAIKLFEIELMAGTPRLKPMTSFIMIIIINLTSPV